MGLEQHSAFVALMLKLHACVQLARAAMGDLTLSEQQRAGSMLCAPIHLLCVSFTLQAMQQPDRPHYIPLTIGVSMLVVIKVQATLHTGGIGKHVGCRGKVPSPEKPLSSSLGDKISKLATRASCYFLTGREQDSCQASLHPTQRHSALVHELRQSM